VSDIVLEMSGRAAKASGSVDLKHMRGVLCVHAQISEGVNGRGESDNISVGTHIDRQVDMM
jgi:hypothetical protein